jgi:hypothetical protein
LRLLTCSRSRAGTAERTAPRHHPGDLDVVVEGQLVAADDVDVGLGELAVAALLRPLAAPHLLDLVAAEGELELAGVLQHVAGERHGQVEVQAEPASGPGRGALVRRPAAAQDVDLLVEVSPLRSSWSSGSTAGSRSAKPCSSKVRAGVDDLLLDDALGGQELGEAAERRGLAHRLTVLG